MTSQDSVISSEIPKVSFINHIVVIWQRFLPYHVARIKQLGKRCAEMGHRLTAVEVASRDESYGFPENKTNSSLFEHICCFPATSYHFLGNMEIYNKVLCTLKDLRPDVVFAPATPFPEGMAAFAYRLYSGNKAIMMDDAWEHTDRKGLFTRKIKKLIHQNIDAVFIPGNSHLPYFIKAGFPEERVILGVEGIDNGYFSSNAERMRANEIDVKASLGLPQNYFLFVGRFLSRKGIEILLAAYSNYRNREATTPWDLVLVGDGKHLDNIRSLARGIPGIIFAGPQFGDNLCQYYALARTLVVPSLSDPWGLVVNEGMASGLPVIVSRGCGAAKTLVHEGENGWTFGPGDVDALSRLMTGISMSPREELYKMGQKSREIISEWSLDRFVDGVLKAIEIPRRPPAGLVSDILTKLWKGRVRIN